jgi:hypothetical protein
MTALIQFIVLKREGKWVVKSKDLERVFSVIDAAIRFANDSGKEGRPGVVLLQKSKIKFEKIWTYEGLASRSIAGGAPRAVPPRRRPAG